MCRSRKKIPIIGNADSSDKFGKRKANRRNRKYIKIAILKENEIIPVLREVSNVYDFGKDGKKYPKEVREEYLRK